MRHSLLIACVLISSLLICGCTTVNDPTRVSSTSMSQQPDSNAFSNATGGAITGKVLDENGIGLVNASITLWQNSKQVNSSNNPQWANKEDLPPGPFFNYILNATLNNAFNKTGNVSIESYYRFDHLASGQYQVTAEMEGAKSSINVSVDDNTTTSDITLPYYLFNRSGARVILQIENYSEGSYDTKVLFSNDSNIAAGSDCRLHLGQPVDYMVVAINPSILVPGVIIGLNDYSFGNGMMMVNVPENTLWTSKVTLLNLKNVPVKYTDSLYYYS